MNQNLTRAKLNKIDEFYTKMEEIERELPYYYEQLKDKIVYCNCDNPRYSNFVLYFLMNFEKLGLEELIVSFHKKQVIDIFLSQEKQDLYLYSYTKDKLSKKIIKTESKLQGDGDFRSEEMIEHLKTADIVVTNPPFSLFREYVAQLMEYKKDFLIIGNFNATTYREIFPLIKDNKMWIGHNWVKEFRIPHDAPQKSGQRVGENGKRYQKFGNIAWFTNLDTPKRHEELVLYKKYDSDYYQKYDNYDAINVDKVNEIPMDYEGVMGVPITFLDKYNPEQFEIIGLGISNSGREIGVEPYKPEHRKYRMEVQKRGAVDGDLYMMVNNIVTVPYARILIKNRKVKK